jgi:hypothetical protein
MKGFGQKNLESSKCKSKDKKSVEIKSHKGPVNLAATSSRNPELLMSEIVASLEREKISIKRVSIFKLICNKSVTVEVNRVGKMKDLFVVRVHEEDQNEELCERVTQKIFEEVSLNEVS